jgi:MscS family membrane protein
MNLELLVQGWSEGWLALPWARALVLAVAAALAAFLAHLIFTRVLIRLAHSTHTDLDNRMLALTRKPVFFTVLLIGLWLATLMLELPDPAPFVIAGFVKSVIIVYWSVTMARVLDLLLGFMTENDRFRLIQVRTQPIFELSAKILVWGGAVYLVLLIWKIDATGWIASAGVVGVAVGFAAKDTVANLISGLFIMADAPYKLGDFVVLGSGERGMVTEIGVRTTRILTRDDFEIIVPNAVIAGAKIINEAGGPHEMRRIRATVDVAYGSDVDQVREVLTQAAADCGYLVAEPAPRVRFREFAPSGLRFQVMGWVEQPVLRGRATDGLNTAVYKGLQAAGIEIPYSKHDVYIREAPAGFAGPPRTVD